jgi:hypothetical protein
MAPYFFEPGRLSRGGSSDLWMSTRELHSPGPRNTTRRASTTTPTNISIHKAKAFLPGVGAPEYRSSPLLS